MSPASNRTGYQVTCLQAMSSIAGGPAGSGDTKTPLHTALRPMEEELPVSLEPRESLANKIREAGDRWSWSWIFLKNQPPTPPKKKATWVWGTTMGVWFVMLIFIVWQRSSTRSMTYYSIDSTISSRGRMILASSYAAKKQRLVLVALKPHSGRFPWQSLQISKPK